MSDQYVSLLDKHFAEFLGDRSELTGDGKSEFIALVSGVSAALEMGHSCLPVNKEQADFLRPIHLVSEGELTPLVLSNGNLYLHRYFHYEKQLSQKLRELAILQHDFEGNLLGDSSVGAQEKNCQEQATLLALRKSLAIICGGPGTGKTTTVVKIITELMNIYGVHLQIALAAPTGKAAMRLADSVSRSLEQFDILPEIIEALPKTAQTLHRLLGYRHGSPQFFFRNDNPMNWDVVVVDESSMVDLAMMSKLVDALKPGARLILLGDRDQLASVESGSVLSDIMASLPDNSIELQKTYRFDDNIKKLAGAIKNGDGDVAWQLLLDPAIENISRLSDDIVTYIGNRYARYMEVAHDWEQRGVDAVFREFNTFQVLSAVHFGAMGVEGINRGVELYLGRKGYDCTTDRWYLGRPLLITQNDYQLELFNGDIGICLPDVKTGAPMVCFLQPGGGVKSFSLHQLPPCETVYSMTIHKSQGSEFDQVVVVLPDEDNRVLSRELVYTGVTRAKESVTVVGERKLFTRSLSKNIKRNSGLQQMLMDRPTYSDGYNPA